jgi:hypothetical protein
MILDSFITQDGVIWYTNSYLSNNTLYVIRNCKL